MAIMFLIFKLMKAVRGKKHPSEAENGMKESINWKNILILVVQQPQKPLDRSNQIFAMTSIKKDTSQWLPRSLHSSLNAMLLLLLERHLEFYHKDKKYLCLFGIGLAGPHAVPRPNAAQFSLEWLWGIILARQLLLLCTTCFYDIAQW